MTCIVGLKTEEGVWIGADSCLTRGNLSTSETADIKVFLVGEFLFSGCGYLRGLDIIKHCFLPPAQLQGQTLENYIYGAFMDSIRALLKKQGFAEEKERKEEHGNGFLFAYRGRLFAVGSDYSVQEHSDYVSYGSGEEFAYGSLFSTERSQAIMAYDPKERVEKAIAAAAKFNPYVSEPISVIFQRASEIK